MASMRFQWQDIWAKMTTKNTRLLCVCKNVYNCIESTTKLVMRIRTYVLWSICIASTLATSIKEAMILIFYFKNTPKNEIHVFFANVFESTLPLPKTYDLSQGHRSCDEPGLKDWLCLRFAPIWLQITCLTLIEGKGILKTNRGPLLLVFYLFQFVWKGRRRCASRFKK